jgi:hypothetical protein
VRSLEVLAIADERDQPSAGQGQHIQGNFIRQHVSFS